MLTSETSLVVMVLITLAAAFLIMAWMASSQNSRKTRALIAYLKENENSYWRSLSWISRNFNRVGVVEAYYRSGQSIDPDFLTLYQAKKSGALIQILAIIMATALIAIVLIGTSLWGWHW